MTLTTREYLQRQAMDSPEQFAALYHMGVIQISPRYNIGAPHQVANVTYWEAATGNLTLPQLTAIQTAFDTSWLGLWASVAPPTNFYQGSVVTDMSSLTGNEVNNATYVEKPGTLAGTPLSDNVAFLISLNTQIRYKGGHGRIYLPGVSEAATQGDGRTIQAAYIASIHSSWTNLVDAMSSIPGVDGGPLNPIVWHKKMKAAPNTVELVAAITPQSILATQRRRLRKVARH